MANFSGENEFTLNLRMCFAYVMVRRIMVKAFGYTLIIVISLLGCNSNQLSTSASATTTQLMVPATHTNLSNPIPMDITGTGTKLIGNISVSSGLGTMEFNNSLFQVLVYHNSAPWTGTTNVDYQAIATNGSSWYALFFQCHGDGTLDDVWYENFDGTSGIVYEFVTNSICSKSTEINTLPVSFPSSIINTASPTKEWSISGSRLNYSQGIGGSFTSKKGEKYELFPFSTVDCSSGCGTPGWYELHTLFYNQTTSNVCFGIIYMTPSTGRVNIGYSICLPTLDESFDGEVQATFEGPNSG